MNRSLLLTASLNCLILFFCVQCSTPGKDTHTHSRFNFDTDSDSARHYFIEGWKKIMDEGRWTASEAAFRKAITYDPEFVLGKTLVGKISRNLEERQLIYKDLTEKEQALSPAGKLLFEVHGMSVEFMNYRESGTSIPPSRRTLRDSISFFNRKEFVHQYPDEAYEKAEYIEVIHHKYGAQSALDSIQSLASEAQLKLPFYIGYQAMLHGELGNHNEALNQTVRLEEVLDEKAPAIYYTRAVVLWHMDSLASAKVMAQQAYQLDTNHLLAKGMVEALQ